MTVTTTGEVMVTTTDNPFSPFTEFTQWLKWDEDAGYYTLPYLARVTRTSDELSFSDQELAIEQAIDEIVSENILGIYRKVTPTTEQKSVSV
jgi:hypothetical protein